MCYYPKNENKAMPFAKGFYCGEDEKFGDEFKMCRVLSAVRLDIPTWAEAKHYYDNGDGKGFHTADSSLDEETFKTEVMFLKRKQKREKRFQSMGTGVTTTTNKRKRKATFGGHYDETLAAAETPSPKSKKRPGQLVNAPGRPT